MRKRKTLHASNAKRKGTTPMNALMNCLRRQIKKGISLLINKEVSSDEEIEDKQYEEEEENDSVTSEEYQMENQDKDNTALDENKTSDDESYEDNSMFSDEDYEGFALIKTSHAT